MLQFTTLTSYSRRLIVYLRQEPEKCLTSSPDNLNNTVNESSHKTSGHSHLVVRA